jgi:alkylation response protein AidB-like acyl-CoA dehydrogenase
LDELLSPETLAWRDKAREIANDVVRPGAWKWDAAQEYPWEVKEALAEAGLMGLWFPERIRRPGRRSHRPLRRRRGALAGLRRHRRGVRRECARLLPDHPGGTEEQKQKYLPPVAKGEKLIAFGLSEKASGRRGQPDHDRHQGR